MKPIVYLDMDGVLSNLDAGLVKFAGTQYVLEDRKQFYIDHLSEYVAANGFYTQPQMPAAKYLVTSLLHYAKEMEFTLAILTSTGQYYSPASTIADQKHKWLETEFPELADAPFITVAGGKLKAKMAHENAYLIDDHEANCQAFRDAGGKAWVYTDDDTSNALYWLLYREMELTVEQRETAYFMDTITTYNYKHKLPNT